MAFWLVSNVNSDGSSQATGMFAAWLLPSYSKFLLGRVPVPLALILSISKEQLPPRNLPSPLRSPFTVFIIALCSYSIIK